MKTLGIEKFPGHNLRIVDVFKDTVHYKGQEVKLAGIKLNIHFDYYKDIKNLDTKVYEFDNMILIITHGTDQGELINHEIISLIEKTSEKPVFVFCCHMEQVMKNYKFKYIFPKTSSPNWTINSNYKIGLSTPEYDYFSDIDGITSLDILDINPEFLALAFS